MIDHTDIINMFVQANGYKTYLEIGVRTGKNFNGIKAEHKDGVDPAGNCNYVMTSDDFFRSLPSSTMYDIIFIDGLHEKEQVLRDVDNSLNHLSDNGTIVMHDCNPINPKHAIKKYPGSGIWNGTVWEAWAELRMSREDLSMYVIDTDHGCGVVRRGNQKLFPREEIQYSLLENKRKELLNLISTNDFVNFKIL